MSLKPLNDDELMSLRESLAGAHGGMIRRDLMMRVCDELLEFRRVQRVRTKEIWGLKAELSDPEDGETIP